MLKTFLIATLLLCICWSNPTAQVGTCPIANGHIFNGTFHIYKDVLTISLTGDIVLIPGTDAICYNYTLPFVFANRPGVALCINKLIQPSSISKVNTVLTYSFRSNLSDQTL